MVKRARLGILTILLSAAAANGWAQGVDLDIANGGTDQIWYGTSANSIAGWWLDKGALSSGDDRADLIIGAPGAASDPGHVYVYFGGPLATGLISLSTADAVLTGSQAGDRFGLATAAGNILTTSGPRDLIVGAPSADSGSSKGRVYLFAGPFTNGQTTPATSALLTIIGQPGDRIGTALATADLNGDGYRELIIGAGLSNKVYVINGGPSLSGTIDLSVTPAAITMTGDSIGNVLAAGDVTGDGRYDLLIGAPLAASSTGRVYLIRGRSGSFPATLDLDASADAVFSGRNPGDNAGAAIKLGDFDHDSIRDVLIGSPGADGVGSGRGNSGEVYLLWGSSSLASMNLAAANVTIYGAAAGDLAGTRLDAGDINRDSPNDIVILSAGARSNQGKIYVIYGRSRAAFGASMDLSTTYDRSLYNSADEGPIGNTAVFEITGEGARDLIIAHPNATAGGNALAGKIYVSLSPKLAPTPLSSSVSVGAGQKTTFVVQVKNPGSGTVPWKAESLTSWMSVSPANGSSTSASTGTFTVTVDAATLDTSNYSGSLRVTSLTNHLEMFVDLSVAVHVTVPVSRVPDVDGDGTPDPTPAVPEYVIGLGRMPGAGGWFEVHAGKDRNFGLAAWARQPWMPYNNASGEVYLALGDVDGDGRDEVVMTFGPAMHGWILILDDDAHDYAIMKWIKLDWDPYTNANGLMYPAVGDLDGDGKAEIVVGLGSGGAGWFRIYDDASTGFAPLKWGRVAWDDYNVRHSGETHPAVADLNGDGKAEIVMGLGNGGAGWVEIFSSSVSNYAHQTWIRTSDNAYNATDGAIWPGAGDIDGDGRAEIVLGLGRGGHGKAEVRDDANAGYASLRWLQTGWTPYDEAVGEIHPAVGNLDSDARAEIILGLGPFSNGGWYMLFDDGNTGNALIGWKRVEWAPYNAAGGSTWPAIGKLR